ncbi:uncharacterized protein N0V89_002676 [Didymosphaeria variabile]|uniref:Uncharacterized protein n=1 Tax=Didymosphaeria variabile TaxID=1932322 RepID=A0A9W8XV87_9PLEO|nr:uncharacterized protein N0V89_002676 [Didymosphaeria variabile]KAJ4358097.1 hypothetical protein N0V89_002676 [Didymosphaeria variabile]
MCGAHSDGETIESASTDLGPQQRAFLENEPLTNATAQDACTEGLLTDSFVADVDLDSAARKLRCNADPDAVSSAIGILLDELDDRDRKIAFFENLFGYSAEHIMTYQEHLIRYEDIRFYGERRLRGKALQQAMLQQTGHEPSLQELGGRFTVEVVHEEHYDFAVALPVNAKARVDRGLSTLKNVPGMRTEGAKAADGSADAAAEDIATDPRAKVLADKKALERGKFDKTLSQDSATQHATIDGMLSDPQPASAQTTSKYEASTEADAARPETKGRKRKLTIVVGDDEDDDRDDGRAKISKAG